MPTTTKTTSKKVPELTEAETGVYKGYDIRWLENEPDHPDYYLVAEYNEKYPKEDK